jgi:hypothetical protein
LGNDEKDPIPLTESGTLENVINSNHQCRWIPGGNSFFKSINSSSRRASNSVMDSDVDNQQSETKAHSSLNSSDVLETALAIKIIF